MKKYIKLLAVIGTAFLMSVTANASDITKTGYDYQNHTVSINELEAQTMDAQELTVLVIKGDKTAADATISGDEIYYVDQASNSTFSTAFNSLGVKGGALEAGVYTIIAGGENVGGNGIKELFIVGNKENTTSEDGTEKAGVPKEIEGKGITYGETRNVQIVENGEKFDYNCICVFDGETLDLSKVGWIFQQKIKNDSGNEVWQHLYKKIGNLTGASDETITKIDAPVSIGLSIKGLTVDPATNYFTAIPCQVTE